MKLPFGLTLGSTGGSPIKWTTLVTHHADYSVRETTGGLSVLFTVMCIVDLFGVFPVITLPKSVIACGIYGLPLVLGVFGLQIYTSILLGKCWLIAQEITPHINEKNRFPYAAVAELAFGVPAKRLVTFLIDAAVFGSGVPNYIIAAQVLQIFWYNISDGLVTVPYCVWMVVLALLLCPVMWLGSPKDMKPLALLSVFIVSTVAVTTWVCIINDDKTPLPTTSPLALQPGLQDFLIAYGILAFQFDIHPILLTLQVDMKDSRKINMAVLGGFGYTACLFAVTTALAGARYGTELGSNILQSIPSTIALYVIALLVTLQLCLSSAVSNSALFQNIEDLLKVPRDFCFRRCLIRSSILATAIFLAEIVPRFDLVMGLIGSTLTGPLMFIFPPIFFLKLYHMRNKRQDITQKGIKIMDSLSYQNGGDLSKSPLISNGSQIKYKTFDDSDETHGEKYHVKWYDVVLAVIVMSIGAITTIVATFTSWSNSIEYATFSPPCIVNATAAARALFDTLKRDL